MQNEFIRCSCMCVVNQVEIIDLAIVQTKFTATTPFAHFPRVSPFHIAAAILAAVDATEQVN